MSDNDYDSKTVRITITGNKVISTIKGIGFDNLLDVVKKIGMDELKWTLILESDATFTQEKPK